MALRSFIFAVTSKRKMTINSASNCPFCTPETDRVFDSDGGIICIWDGYPVSDGHALVIPRRHFASWFEATEGEHADIQAGILRARDEIERLYSPDGFNIGINIGEAAGQTVDHLHIHVIPRYRGDVRDPRGGIRHVVPAKGNYLRSRKDAQDAADEYPGAVASRNIFGTDEAPLLEALELALSDASAIDLAIAFVLESGLREIEPYLLDLLEAGGRMRFLSGDYLDVTEPRALRRVLDWAIEHPNQVDARVFQTDRHTGFHPKAYLLHRGYLGATAFVGSSNLTRHALRSGVEWNQRLEGALSDPDITGISREFARLFRHPRTAPLSADWISAYNQRRKVPVRPIVGSVDSEFERPLEPAKPHEIQREALGALHDTRLAGNKAGLIVLATGLGKTWLAAFDSCEFERVLFVAHREEILNQALDTFRRIRPDSNLGKYGGGRHEKDADVLFASIQTLGRENHLSQFAATHFDYIVVDEFHHAAAATYRRLIDHFEPKFLLALTATPERTDGGDLLGLCAENLVYNCNLFTGIEQGLLCPFAYYGVPDEVDFSNIPWRSGRFDPKALEFAIATEKRALNAFEQWKKHGQSRTLAFCVSQRHADFMAEFFRVRGVAAVAVHAGPSTAPRTRSLEQLEHGEIQVVFAVDMFNEGVDVPAIDTVMMLRPTESRILWLQQFGRGLRRAPQKSRLTVVDYIGNHRAFLQVPALLLPGVSARPGEISRALAQLERGELTLPAGCSIEYELEALDILKRLTEPTSVGHQIALWYRTFREINDRRPTASEAYHVGYDPKGVRSSLGSWFAFVKSEGDLSTAEETAFVAHKAFLDALEVTPMTKSFKMMTLLAMIGNQTFPGSIGISALANEVGKAATRNKSLRDEFGGALDDPASMRELLENNPIQAWTGGRGTKGQSYFSYENGVFASFEVPADTADALRDLARELCDYRLAAYLDRLQNSTTRERRTSDPDTAAQGHGELWQEYFRSEIPTLWNLEFSPSKWNQGFVQEGSDIFLLVSLDKGGLAEAHQYEDKFLTSDLFQWVSQNRTRQNSRAGKAIANHEVTGSDVHLFVRDRRKTPSGSGAPFVYCGEVAFVDWKSERPITVRWRLKNQLPIILQRRFGLQR